MTFGALALLGCGGPTRSGFENDAGSTADGETPEDDSGFFNFPDTSVEAAPPCVGLKCQQVTCQSGKTTVSGTVYDPAGKNPLYNVVVYVPNADLDAIKHGPVCDSCGGASVSGSPVVTALTDANGKFVLENVPVGANIPLVMQAGKWRRKLVIPTVNQCVDNPVGQKTAGVENLTRLPRNKKEGDMPLIALTGGCDPIHTLVQKIGIDPAEMTSELGSGTVHVYSGSGGQNGGVSGATDAYAFWGNKTKMMKYDIILNECECSPYLRSTQGPGYANMSQYLNAGGRVFVTHYHLNFFGADPSNPSGTPDPTLSSAATWTLWGGSSGSAPYLIDTTFPKGKAMDDWLHNLKTASGWGGSLPITSPKGQIVVAYNDGDIGAAKPGISQRWVYTGSGGSSVVYLSINTPTSAPADQRCGRAVASDMHVGNGSLTSMTEQEAALEFMFFDLASCVIDAGKVPVPPVPN
ncbi:hypothetical protein BH09MYX1_BH09MYX1_61730 [soil metagenome]